MVSPNEYLFTRAWTNETLKHILAFRYVVVLAQ